MTSAITFNQLQHIGIPVSDLHVSQGFYEQLGFNTVMTAAFGRANQQGTCMMMKNGGLVLELYQLPPEDLSAIRERKDGHIDHIAFDVDNIDIAFEQAKAGSYHIVEPAPVFLSFWAKGCRYFNIIGPDGERLEFNEVIK